MNRKVIGYFLGLVLLLGGVLFIPLAFHTESEERHTSGVMMACSNSVREEIANAILSGNAVTSLPTNECPSEISAISVSEEHVLILENSKFSIRLVFKPTIHDQKVNWSCNGMPENYVPIQCRTKT